MSEKIYAATLKSSDDLEGFYSDMKSNGFKLYQKRPMSRTTTYKITEAQAEDLKKDSRVLAVEELPSKNDLELLDWSSFNFTTRGPMSQEFRKSGDGDGWDQDWAKLHCTGTDAQRRKAPNVNTSQGFWNSTSQSVDAEVTDDMEFFGDGRHVDVVIVDGTPSYDAAEWVNITDSWDTNGDIIPAGQSRFHQYDWYGELNQYVTSIDDDGESVSGSNYTYYPPASSNTNYHGMHVCGTVAGQWYGWANKANIYSFDLFNNNIDSLILFDYIRAFHRHKPINKLTGRRNPTVCNHSWGYIYNFYQQVDNSLDPGDISGVMWDGTWYTSSSPGPSGWTAAGLAADFAIYGNLGSPYNKPPRRWTATDQDVMDQINDGVVHIGAAGNNHMWQVPEIDPKTGIKHVSFDNYVSVNGYGSVYLCRGGSPNGSCNNGLAGGLGICPINVGATGNRADNRPASFSNFGPKLSTWAPGQNIISSMSKNWISDPKYGGDNWFGEISGTSMASPQVCGIAACLASGGRPRFTNSDLLGYIQLLSKKGDMSFDVAPASNSSYNMYLSLPSGTDHFTVSGSDSTGTYHNAALDPTITITVGDTLTFSHPGENPSLWITSFTNNSHYVVEYIDRTNMFALQPVRTTANDPTIHIEQGDFLQLLIYSYSGGTTYIKTAPSIGNSDLVQQGGFSPSNGWAQTTGFWDTTGVTPGTYYYQDSVQQSCGGQIVVHPQGTYYYHPLNFQTNNQLGGPAPSQGTIISQGSPSFKHANPISWNTQGVPEGTYYYVHGSNANMWGEIHIVAKGGTLGQAGNFADLSCQKDSPNQEIMAYNPRKDGGLLSGWNKSSLKGYRRHDEFNLQRDIQIYPRTNTLYAKSSAQWTHYYDVSSSGGKYVMTGSDRMDTYAAKENPVINITIGDKLSLTSDTSTTSSHPLWIGLSQQTGTVTWQASMGTITNNGNGSGSTIVWDTTGALPGTYYYNCEYHSTMTGTIFVNE